MTRHPTKQKAEVFREAMGEFTDKLLGDPVGGVQ